MKSSSKVWDIIVIQGREVAHKFFEELETSATDEPCSGSPTYPCFEAIVGTLKLVYEAIVEFPASHEPTVHEILPSLHYCKTELRDIEFVYSICRGSNNTCCPSIYSMRLCCAMKQELEKIEIHGFWLVSCFPYPFLRDLKFWKDPMQREHFKSGAEKPTRSMYDSYDSPHTNSNSSGFGSQYMDSKVAVSLEPQRKRNRFSLENQLSVLEHQETETDKESWNKSTQLIQFCLGPYSFVSDPFSVIQFWDSRKSMYPTLFKVSMRIFATPASSSSRERAFSTLKKLVAPDHASMSTKHISEIINARSLRFYQ